MKRMERPQYQPFYFRGGGSAANIPDLISLCFERPEDGLYHLAAGHIEAWLRYLDRMDLALVATQARTTRRLDGLPLDSYDSLRLVWFLEHLCFERKRSQAGLPYLLHVPAETSGRRRLPLILFLHGAAERGADPGQLKHHGLAGVVSRDPDFPFIVVVPQCPAENYWGRLLDPLNGLLAEVTSALPVDLERIYLTGVSMGGAGVWALAGQVPDLFAALVPICGGGDPALAPRLASIPVLAFHGAQDRIVPPSRSMEMVEAVRASGGDARLIIYPDLGHECWLRTYNDPDLYHWLLEHRRT
jgi:predicted peptidase